MKYDVAVIGAGIAGLTTAALLTRSGKRVIVLDPRPQAGGRLAPQTLGNMHAAPFPPLVHGFERDGLFRRLYDALGIPMPTSTTETAYQVILPDHRLTIYPDRQATLDEVAREFPDAGHSMARLLREAGALSERASRHPVLSSLHRHRSAAGFLFGKRLPSLLVAMLDAQALFFHGVRTGELSLAEFVSLLTVPPAVLEGGYERLAAALSRLIAEGGVSRSGESWPEMHVRSNRVVRLVTDRGGIEARSVIVNAVFFSGVSSYCCGVRADGIPIGMREAVILIDDLSRPFDVAAVTRRRMHGEEAVTITRVDAGTSNATGRPLPDRLSSIMPFLGDFTTVSSVRDFSSERYALPPHVTIGTGREGAEGRTSVRSSVGNLYVIPDHAPLGRSLAAAFRLSRMLR